MIDFINRFFKRESSSGTAKERLRLVLLSDRISLAPDVVEALKADLLEVISRYVEVDESHTEINFEQREREVAMLANIPILSLKPRPPAAPVAPEPQVPPAAPLQPAPAQAVALEQAVAVRPAPAKPKPRRRRKRPNMTPAQSFGKPAEAT